MAQERYGEALELLEAFSVDIESSLEAAWIPFTVAEAALALGQLERAEAAVAEAEAWDPGSTGPIIRAQVARVRGLLAAAQEDSVRAGESFKGAIAAWREYDVPFLLACTELEYAESLVAEERLEEAAPLVTEARETFERLRATPWLERADALEARLPARVTTAA
jgi:tetratricopeptide (TPR) repeat protein